MAARRRKSRRMRKQSSSQRSVRPERAIADDPAGAVEGLPGLRVPFPAAGGDAVQDVDGGMEAFTEWQPHSIEIPHAGARRTQEAPTLRLSELLRKDLIRMPLLSTTMPEAVRELIEHLVEAGELPANLTHVAFEAIRERHAIRSTGWKYGLAFPNGRVRELMLVTAVIGISQVGVDFDCLDGLPAKIVVMLFFPARCYSKYAGAIPDLADLLADPGLRERILAARRPVDVVEAMERAESFRFG